MSDKEKLDAFIRGYRGELPTPLLIYDDGQPRSCVIDVHKVTLKTPLMSFQEDGDYWARIDKHDGKDDPMRFSAEGARNTVRVEIVFGELHQNVVRPMLIPYPPPILPVQIWNVDPSLLKVAIRHRKAVFEPQVIWSTINEIPDKFGYHGDKAERLPCQEQKSEAHFRGGNEIWTFDFVADFIGLPDSGDFLVSISLPSGKRREITFKY